MDEKYQSVVLVDLENRIFKTVEDATSEDLNRILNEPENKDFDGAFGPETNTTWKELSIETEEQEWIVLFDTSKGKRLAGFSSTTHIRGDVRAFVEENGVWPSVPLYKQSELVMRSTFVPESSGVTNLEEHVFSERDVIHMLAVTHKLLNFTSPKEHLHRMNSYNKENNELIDAYTSFYDKYAGPIFEAWLTRQGEGVFGIQSIEEQNDICLYTQRVAKELYGAEMLYGPQVEKVIDDNHPTKQEIEYEYGELPYVCGGFLAYLSYYVLWESESYEGVYRESFRRYEDAWRNEDGEGLYTINSEKEKEDFVLFVSRVVDDEKDEHIEQGLKDAEIEWEEQEHQHMIDSYFDKMDPDEAKSFREFMEKQDENPTSYEETREQLKVLVERWKAKQ